jgi:hypothetical protein
MYRPEQIHEACGHERAMESPSMCTRHHLLLFAALSLPALEAAELELKPDTLQCWDEYVQKAKLAIEQRGHGAVPFLWMDENPDRAARVSGGEIVVWPVGDTSPKRVPSGLIHDWIGAAFIPGVRIEDILTVVRDYSRYKDIYKPGVLDAKLLSQAGAEDRFSMLLRNGSFFTKTAIDGEFSSSYTKLEDGRWQSESCLTRVQEIENYGLPGERKLSPDAGHGYIWRMCSLSQLEERDGGVYVNEELIALSRDVPSALRWMAGPIIRRVARESVAASIEKTRQAVKARAADVTNISERTGGLSGCGHVGAAGCLR